jgi:ribokinase
MIGRIGDDGFANRLLANLQREQIDCHWVRETPNCASGLAVVAVERSGQNAIFVVPNANGCLQTDDVDGARSAIEGSDVLLLQLEVPLETVQAAVRIASAADVRVVLDPAPAPAGFPAELLQVDLLCPNESEAAAIVGQKVDTIEDAQAAARQLHGRGARHVAITLGEKGTLLFDGNASHLIEPFPTIVVDTTAAGDAFAGALAVFWAETDDLLEAVRFANAAGAIAASREGAQPGMASRDEIESLWRTIK